jgi:hypothetical protein
VEAISAIPAALERASAAARSKSDEDDPPTSSRLVDHPTVTSDGNRVAPTTTVEKQTVDSVAAVDDLDDKSAAPTASDEGSTDART